MVTVSEMAGELHDGDPALEDMRAVLVDELGMNATVFEDMTRGDDRTEWDWGGLREYMTSLLLQRVNCREDVEEGELFETADCEGFCEGTVRSVFMDDGQISWHYADTADATEVYDSLLLLVWDNPESIEN